MLSLINNPSKVMNRQQEKDLNSLKNKSKILIMQLNNIQISLSKILIGKI